MDRPQVDGEVIIRGQARNVPLELKDEIMKHGAAQRGENTAEHGDDFIPRVQIGVGIQLHGQT